MTDIGSWDIAAGNNNDAVPDGFPEGMPYSGVNNSAREVMASVARFYADNNGSLITAGAGNAYTIATNQSITSYAVGLSIVFRTDRANTSTATLNLNAISAIPLRKEDGVELEAAELGIGAYHAVYDGTQFLLTGSTSSIEEVTLSDLPTFTPTLTSIFHGLNGTNEDATATSQAILELAKVFADVTTTIAADRIVVADSANGDLLKGITQANFLVNVLTDLTASDSFVVYDNATGLMKKILETAFLGTRQKSIEATDRVAVVTSANQLSSVPQSGLILEEDVTNIASDPGGIDIGSFQVRWGSVTSTVDTAEVFNFVTAFTTACHGVPMVTKIGADAESDRAIWAESSTASTFTINRNDNVDGSVTLFYIAVGY